MSSPESAARGLKRLIQRPARVTRNRRAALIAGCLIIPAITFCSSILTANMIQKGVIDQPELAELSQLLLHRQEVKAARVKNPDSPDDRLYEIYIAHHYRDIVGKPEIWDNFLTLAVIRIPDREFVEQSIRNYPGPTEAQIAEAEAAIGSFVSPEKIEKAREKLENSSIRLLLYLGLAGANLLFYLALPAMIAALCFRGGLVLLIFSVGVVRKDGLPASRIRIFWRSFLAWATPFILAGIIAALLNPFARPILTSVMVILMTVGLTAWSTLMPDRGIPDRLSGTRLVPR